MSATPSQHQSSNRTFTADERRAWELKVAEEENAMPANLARLERMAAAVKEPTFSGELRRTIRDAKVPTHDLAARVGVSWRQLQDFQAGDAALPTDAVDRLIAALSLTAKLESRSA